MWCIIRPGEGPQSCLIPLLLMLPWLLCRARSRNSSSKHLSHCSSHSSHSSSSSSSMKAYTLLLVLLCGKCAPSCVCVCVYQQGM